MPAKGVHPHLEWAMASGTDHCRSIEGASITSRLVLGIAHTF
jgi:hypothetical protein